ncbi:MAG: hypothetical protein K0Q73_5433 [Paenibacillus sp.]|jgi:predicted secreted protein|nr:hypothetical protein [Paenibacillus sp.]
MACTEENKRQWRIRMEHLRSERDRYAAEGRAVMVELYNRGSTPPFLFFSQR